MSEPRAELTYLNSAPEFWPTYQNQAGALRRQALLSLFQKYPLAKLPVNNKWQASSEDPDLRQLLKKGVLIRSREGGLRQHPLNRSSAKRQTYLLLATQNAKG